MQKLKSGEIAATIVVTGKPAPALANIKDTSGLKLLAVPYAKELEDSYYPATLTHDDYPELIAEGNGSIPSPSAPCWCRSTGRRRHPLRERSASSSTASSPISISS